MHSPPFKCFVWRAFWLPRDWTYAFLSTGPEELSTRIAGKGESEMEKLRKAHEAIKSYKERYVARAEEILSRDDCTGPYVDYIMSIVKSAKPSVPLMAKRLKEITGIDIPPYNSI
jgi:hypothetical protein